MTRVRVIPALLIAALLLMIGPVEAGLLFDSSSDYLKTLSDVAIPTTGTYCFNVYPNWAQTDGADHRFFSISDTGETNFFTGLKFTDNKLYFGWFTGSVEYRVIVASGSYTLNQSAWNVFCLTWDGSGSALYLNGSSIGTASAPTTWTTSAENFYLGNLRPSGSTPQVNMDGRLAEGAFWNRVLSGSELTDRMNGRISSCISSGLLVYWSLNDTTDIGDHADSADLVNVNVTNAANHPSTLACSGGGGTFPCVIGGGFFGPGCPG